MLNAIIKLIEAASVFFVAMALMLSVAVVGAIVLQCLK